MFTEVAELADLPDLRRTDNPLDFTKLFINCLIPPGMFSFGGICSKKRIT